MKLVAPLFDNTPVQEQIIEFQGLNKRPVIQDGEMREMWNLTSDNYPVLTPRKPRGEVALPSGVMRPFFIVTRYNKVGMIAIDTNNNVSFYFDGEKVSQVTGLSTETKAVAINTKLCFFPQRTYLEIYKDNDGAVQVGSYGNLDAQVTLSSDASMTVSEENIKVTVPSGHGLKSDDAVDIEGTITYTPQGGTSKTISVAVSCAIEDIVNSNTLVLPSNLFLELISDNASNVVLKSGTTFKRQMPDLDYVIEWNNRLWGVNNKDNTVYACKLGDPTNWHYFQSTSLDSYYAQQGTDEVFTGMAEYSGHIICFKPNSMTRVYGTSPSNYQITTTACYGVEEGSSKSVQTINDTVYYKSSIGIMAYQGGIPVCISDKINRKFKNVVAGTEGNKYYASCLIDEQGEIIGRILVFDIKRGFWHMEDNLRFTDCCKVGDKLYYTTATVDILTCGLDVICNRDLMVSTSLIEGTTGIINPDVPTESYEDMEWKAEFGPFDEYIEEHKIYSKLAIRLKANGEASAKVYISINEGEWEMVEDYPHVSTKGDFIPIVPRRCDRYSVKIEGKGNCEVKSITRRVRKGSFGRL